VKYIKQGSAVGELKQENLKEFIRAREGRTTKPQKIVFELH